MIKLFTIQAKIKINTEGGRTWDIKSGYRPGFSFIPRSQTSGAITLLNEEKLSPGEQGIVEVKFVTDKLLGDIKPGIQFKFYEGHTEIGSGEVLEVVGWVER